jgi:hypothetical protein
MPSNFSANGVDLDDKFMPFAAGGSAGTTNYSVSETDLNARYQPRGSTPKIADVGYQTGGSDISNTFMEKHNCVFYQLYYGFDGNAEYEYRNCYGGTSYISDYTWDPGNYGQLLPFTTDCAWQDEIYSLSDNGSFVGEYINCS